MRYIIASALAGLAIVAPAFTATDSAETPTCYEDQVMVWQGSTKQHTACVDVDDPHLADRIAETARS